MARKQKVVNCFTDKNAIHPSIHAPLLALSSWVGSISPFFSIWTCLVTHFDQQKECAGNGKVCTLKPVPQKGLEASIVSAESLRPLHARKPI